MNTIKPSAIQFSGYRLEKNGQARLYLPGHQDTEPGEKKSIQAQVYQNGQLSQVPLKYNPAQGYWESETTVPTGAHYRFEVKPNEKNELTAEVGGKAKPLPFKNGAWEYTLDKDTPRLQDIRISGDNNTQLVLEKHDPVRKSTQTVPLARTATGWSFKTAQKDSDGTVYRLSVPLDYLEVADVPGQGRFNRISLHEQQGPQKSAVIADIYADSILTRSQLAELNQRERAAKNWQTPEGKQVPLLPMRNHFNKFNRITMPVPDKKSGQVIPDYQSDDVTTHGYEDGLNELLPNLQQQGFSAVLFKPFMGGDNISSHRYWTTDPYLLNDTFRNKDAFRTSLDTMLKHGMKVFADGAFVNQGLNGVQVMSNLKHRGASPYWQSWFHFENSETGGRKTLPTLAHEKYAIGILPTRLDDKGHREVDYSGFDVRFINAPVGENVGGKEYDANKPTFIELFDPRLENKDGTLKKSPDVSAHELANSKNSVQKYRFPVDPKELAEKFKEAGKVTDKETPEQRKQAEKLKYTEWSNFRLTTPGADNSSQKWDGQIDVALLNTQSQPVVNYLKGAVNYWSRMVMNHYTASVATAMQSAKTKLQQAGNAAPTYGQILEAVTAQKPGEDKVLPPISHPMDRISAEEAQKLAEAKPDVEADQAGQQFAKTLLSDVPLNTIHLPILFKANLSHERFLKSLVHERTGVSGFLENKVFGTLSKIPALGPAFRWISHMVLPPNLEKTLGQQLQHVFDQLSDAGEATHKLHFKAVQSVVADQLGEAFYISLLTGKSLAEAKQLAQSPGKLEDAIYNSLPPSLLKADPEAGARLLIREFRNRLSRMNQAGANGQKALSVQLREAIEKAVQPLDPNLVALAQGVLNRREFGLNWRIDAAKDVGDMDAIRNAPDSERAKTFKTQMAYVQKFWGEQLTPTMRAPFSKASVIAELTDFHSLAGDNELAQKTLNGLFQSNTFNGTPNMSHGYSPPLQAINYAQRPDEFGNSQITPNRFINKHVRGMTQSVDRAAQGQYQNMTASHDYSTSSHALMVNPELFNADRDREWGLRQDFQGALDELANMACFESERQALKAQGLSDSKMTELFKHLNTWAEKSGGSHIASELEQNNPLLKKEFYDGELKKNLTSADTPQEKKKLYIPTPRDVKAQFPQVIFKLARQKAKDGKDITGEAIGSRSNIFQSFRPVAQLNLPDSAWATVQAQIESRIMEPSEAKAMRAVINNAVEETDFKGILGRNAALHQETKAALWDGLNQAIQQWQAHFGYQEFDVALNHVFEKALPKLPEALKNNPAPLEALKVAISEKAHAPVLEKLKRVYSIQNALPGNPSVYLPDLTAQTGSEWTKNIYGQNRGIIRADRLQDPAYADYFKSVGNLFKTRASEEMQVLHDGLVIPVEADDQHGILPIVRDNGRDQVIALTHTGLPGLDANPANNKVDKIKPGVKTGLYNTVAGTWQQGVTVKGGLKLKSPYIQPGTVYEDVLNGNEAFKVDAQGQLKPLSGGNDFSMQASRLLKRKPKTPTATS